jgi:hypothetical protein
MASRKHTRQDATRPTKARERRERNGHAGAVVEEPEVRETNGTPGNG